MGYVSFNVFDLDRSLDFYVRKLGMAEQRRIPLAGGVSEIVLEFPGPSPSAGLILMFNDRRQQPYQQGDAFSRLVLRVSGIQDLVKRLAAEGVPVVRAPTTAANLNLTYALVRDPDGYLVEFIQND
jgi:lactoylglutathione lyase